MSKKDKEVKSFLQRIDDLCAVDVWIEDYGENVPVGREKMFKEEAYLKRDVDKFRSVFLLCLKEFEKDIINSNFPNNYKNLILAKIKRFLGGE